MGQASAVCGESPFCEIGLCLCSLLHCFKSTMCCFCSGNVSVGQGISIMFKVHRRHCLSDVQEGDEGVVWTVKKLDGVSEL